MQNGNMGRNMGNSRTLSLFNTRFHLLIVDDDPIMVESLTAMLGESFEVTGVTSAHDALEQCSIRRPDVVLLDVNMPEINGIELCRRINEYDLQHRIPVLFLTSIESEETREACWEAGCVDFLAKPARRAEIAFRILLHTSMKLRIDSVYEQQASWEARQYVSNSDWLIDFVDNHCDLTSRFCMPFSIIVIKLQSFLSISASQGYQNADSCVTDLTHAALECMDRTNNIFVRFKSDSFIWIMPEAGPEAARHYAFLLRQKLKESQNASLQEQIDAMDIVCLSNFDMVPAQQMLNTADLVTQDSQGQGSNQQSIVFKNNEQYFAFAS